MNKKLLAIAVTVAAGAFSAAASAATVTYTYNEHAGAAFGNGYVLSTTNWTTLLNLPKFNLPGTLTGAVLRYGGDFNTNGAVDSEDADINGTDVSANVGVSFRWTANGTNGSTNIGMAQQTKTVLSELFAGHLDQDNEGGVAVAGDPDYVGTDAASGLSVGGATSGANSFNIANLAAVSGAGTFDVYTQALGTTNTIGSANLSYDILTQARGQIWITYTYNEPPTVPAPAALPLLGIGAIAMVAAARRKKAA